MAPERAGGFVHALYGLRRPAEHVSPGVGVALFATAAVAWAAAVHPARVLALRPGALGPEEAVLVLLSIVGVLSVLAGLFAIAVYAVNWPTIRFRENVEMLSQARAELADLRRRVARVSAQMAALRELRAEIAMYEAQLGRARAASHHDPGGAAGNGLELVDDIISEL